MGLPHPSGQVQKHRAPGDNSASSSATPTEAIFESSLGPWLEGANSLAWSDQQLSNESTAYASRTSSSTLYGTIQHNRTAFAGFESQIMEPRRTCCGIGCASDGWISSWRCCVGGAPQTARGDQARGACQGPCRILKLTVQPYAALHLSTRSCKALGFVIDFGKSKKDSIPSC